jgi:hypothetical protein
MNFVLEALMSEFAEGKFELLLRDNKFIVIPKAK